jgi:hypothetical protein
VEKLYNNSKQKAATCCGIVVSRSMLPLAICSYYNISVTGPTLAVVLNLIWARKVSCPESFVKILIESLCMEQIIRDYG